MEDIPNFDVTPGISAYVKSHNFPRKCQGEPPGSHARAIILEEKLMTSADFVIKYFISPQNIGENKVGVEKLLFFPHHCTALTKRFHCSNSNCTITTLKCSNYLEFFLRESLSMEYCEISRKFWRAAWRTFARATKFENAKFLTKQQFHEAHNIKTRKCAKRPKNT